MEGAADGVVVLQLLPGVVLSLLVAQRDLVVLTVDILHIHLDGVADRDDLRGMLDAVPAQLADVAQAVHTADIDECTVRGQALDNAGVALAHFDICPELLTLCLVLLSGDLVDAADDLAAGALGNNLLSKRSVSKTLSLPVISRPMIPISIPTISVIPVSAMRRRRWPMRWDRPGPIPVQVKLFRHRCICITMC